MSEPLVPVADIQSEAGWTVDVDGVEVRRDWADRPAVPASVAGQLYQRAVEERDIEARRRMVAADEQIVLLERARPLRGGIPAPPGSNAPAAAVMVAFDADPEKFEQR